MKKEIKLTINKEQRKHLESIQWLFSEGNRQQGRSLLLAYVYINEALKGREVVIIDHAYVTSGTGYFGNKRLAEMIWKIIRKNELPLEIIWSRLVLKKHLTP